MFKIFFLDTSRGIVAVFKGRNIFWHFLAIAVTYVLVISGVDWWYFTVTRGATANTLGPLVGIVGFFVPVLIPLSLYIFGHLRQDVELRTLSKELFQTLIVALIVIAGYKAFTGRFEPEFLIDLTTNDISRAFNFGFLRHGILWGWPSSHTGTAFAMSVFLALWYRHKKWIGLVAILYASFIAIGAGVSFHWLSDMVAGIIIGSLIGYTAYNSSSKKRQL